MLLAEMSLFEIISNATYGALAGVALWGLYCIVIVWSRVNQKRFKSEEEQDFFMDDIEQMLAGGDFEGVTEYCEGDKRAVAQIVGMAVEHREMGYKKARTFVMDRFQRDVMSDVEYRLSWASTLGQRLLTSNPICCLPPSQRNSQAFSLHFDMATKKISIIMVSFSL